MTLQDYTQDLGARGLLLVKDKAFGQMNGYPYYIYPNFRGYVIHSLAAVFHFRQNVRPRYLKKAVADASLTSGSNPGTLTMMVRIDKLPAGENAFDLFFSKMGAFTTAARNLGLTAPDKCPICKRGGCDSLALFSQGYVPTHRACVEHYNFDEIQKARDNSQNGNHGLGILGAFLGAMAACLLIFLLAMASGRIYGMLYIAVPLAAYYGYKLFKGRMDKTVLISVLIFSILSLFAFEFANFAVEWHRQIGGWLSLPEIFAYYFQLMSFGDMLMDMAMPALFLLFGILLDWNIIKNGNKNFVENAQNQLKTLMVLDPQAPAASKAEVEKAAADAATVQESDLGEDVARQSGKQTFSEALKEYQEQQRQREASRKDPGENPQSHNTFDGK